MDKSNLNIAVLGAGVVGLTTAKYLQSEFRNCNVNIIAEDVNNSRVTSTVAAGIFRPGNSFCGPTAEITQKWISESYVYWDEIRKCPESASAGVSQISGYIFSNQNERNVKNKHLEVILPVYRSATDDELSHVCPGNWKWGSFFTTLVTDCCIYLPWVLNELKSTPNVNIIQQKISNLRDLLVDFKYNYVVNCTGLGAQSLCNDEKLVPIRGQVLKVFAPWIKTFFYADFDTYVIPGVVGGMVTLGGCRNFDSYDLNVSRYDSCAIRERCELLVPSLKNAPLIEEKIGLRPHRNPVRVELEIVEIAGIKRKIIHNYGHGGYGVTTAPGTAIHAANLLKKDLISNAKL